MLRHWFKRTIARKLLLAFFSIFIITYVVTALVVQSSVRTAVTQSELATLSQLAHLNLASFNDTFDGLATNLRSWSKLDVMNDLASGDVDKRVAIALENLKKDYSLKGQIYAFNAAGDLIATSDAKHSVGKLPEVWKSHDAIRFINKHVNPLDKDDIVAMSVPVMANFSQGYQLGTLVVAYHWDEIRSAMPERALLLYRQPVSSASHTQSLVLLESTLHTTIPDAALPNLTRHEGWVEIGNDVYLVKGELQHTGLLSGWEVVMLRDPDSLYKTVHMVIFKLAALGLIMTMPLIFAIRWLAGRLTEPVRELTQFVSEIAGTHDLSKRLKLDSQDEIGILAADFNRMTARLASGTKAHREAEARLRATINNALDAVVQMSSDGIITGWNDQASKIFGWSRKEAVGRLLHETIVPLQHRDKHLQGMKHYLSSGVGTVLNSRIEITAIHRDGHEFPVELSITTIKVEGAHEFSAFIRDITNKKESEDLIWKQANFDKVTGLPNRHMFHDRLEQEVKKSHRDHLQMALLFIDLDRFKEINDTLGHDMGDILLMNAASRISGCVRESDTVARLGGDEFTVILSEIHDDRNVERLVQSILKVLSQPFQLGDEVGYISASIGITLYPDDATDVDELLRNADQAMYVAKAQGRNQASYFTAALQESAQDRRRLANDLRNALAEQQFVVHFQPIVNLATGRISKAEALIRWQHPTRGLVDPLAFIQIAEETGLINSIGEWVFRESARWCKRWKDRFAEDFQISVNVSPIQFQSEESFCDACGAYLENIGLDGRSIVVEITEGLLLKASDGITDKLLNLRDAGIQVAIDDFGTGYSSLSYLKKFDIDYLKIDKSFVDNLEFDPNDMALSEAIIVMAHKLGLKVIAEGVENEAQRKLLFAAGCDYAQGYLISKPLSAESFEALLQSVQVTLVT